MGSGVGPNGGPMRGGASWNRGQGRGSGRGGPTGRLTLLGDCPPVDGSAGNFEAESGSVLFGGPPGLLKNPRPLIGGGQAPTLKRKWNEGSSDDERLLALHGSTELSGDGGQPDEQVMDQSNAPNIGHMARGRQFPSLRGVVGRGGPPRGGRGMPPRGAHARGRGRPPTRGHR